MFWSLFFPTVLAFASTCTGLIKDPRCESKRVLGLNSFTLYTTPGKEIDVLPIWHEDRTELQWIVRKGYGEFVKQIYRRLVITDISQFAWEYAWYRLIRNGTTVYTSARVYALIGSRPVLTLNIKPVVAIEYGESYRVCFEYSGSPLPEINLHNKTVSGGIVLRVSNSCLEVHSADYGATSAYILEAFNCFGSANKSFRLKVTERPKLAIQFRSATGDLSTVSEGSSLSIKVNGNLALPYTVGGDPHPSVEWFHNDSMLDDSKYNASHLTLHDVKSSDAGTYVVVAHSVYGRTNRSFWLSVRVPRYEASTGATSSDTSDTPSVVRASAHASFRVPHSDTAILFTTDAPQKRPTPGQLNCDEENPDDSCDDTSEFPWWIVVVCAVVALGVVVIVVMVICCCRKDEGHKKDPEKSDRLKEDLKHNGTTENEVILSDSESSIKIHFEAVVVEDNYDHIPCGDLYPTLSADGGVGRNKPANDSDIRLYSSVDKDSKKQAPSADYSNIDKSKEENTLRYADLDQEAMEEALPPRPRYEAVEYSEINFIQPGPRQE